MAKDGMLLTDKPSWGQKPLTDKKTQKKGLVIPQKDKGMPFITFSFKYFGQQEFFGIGEQDAVWFANLFDRIKDLSGKTRAVLENPIERDAYRLHPIDWSAKNCPISIADLASVPQNIKKLLSFKWDRLPIDIQHNVIFKSVFSRIHKFRYITMK